MSRPTGSISSRLDLRVKTLHSFIERRIWAIRILFHTPSRRGTFAVDKRGRGGGPRRMQHLGAGLLLAVSGIVFAASEIVVVDAWRRDSQGVITSDTSVRNHEDPSFWVHKTVIDAAACGGCTSSLVISDLSQSYAASPMNEAVAPWRLLFIFNHWNEMSPSLRQNALTELQACWSVEGNRIKLKALINNIRDPSGALYYRILTSN